MSALASTVVVAVHSAPQLSIESAVAPPWARPPRARQSETSAFFSGSTSIHWTNATTHKHFLEDRQSGNVKNRTRWKKKVRANVRCRLRCTRSLSPMHAAHPPWCCDCSDLISKTKHGTRTKHVVGKRRESCAYRPNEILKNVPWEYRLLVDALSSKHSVKLRVPLRSSDVGVFGSWQTSSRRPCAAASGAKRAAHRSTRDHAGGGRT